MLHHVETVTGLIRGSGIPAEARSLKGAIVVTCRTWSDADQLDALFASSALPTDRIICRIK